MKKAPLIGYLCAVTSAVIYGLMPLMASYIYADGVDSVTLVFLRNLLAVPTLFLLAAWEKKKKGLSPPPLKAIPSIALIALLGCTITPALLFSSYRFIPSGTATVIHFVYPAAVVLGGILFCKKKVEGRSLLSVLLCVAGVFCFYDPSLSMDLTGAFLAFLSGLTFASYILLLDRFRSREISGFVFSFLVSLISAVAAFLMCLFTGGPKLPQSLFGWLLCLLFAQLVTTGAVVLFQKGTFLIGGERSSILSTVEPVTALLVGIGFFGEPFGFFPILGSCLVILSALLIAYFDMKKEKK